MRIEEFKPLMVRVEAWWPGTQWDDAMIAVWFDDLRQFDAEQVRVAFEHLKREHVRPFAPSMGEVLRLLERGSQADRPTFDEAYPTIYRAAAKQQMPEAHPLVAAFIERQGMARLGTLPLDDPEWGEKTRRDLKAAWEQHTETWDGRELAAIASGQPRRLDPAASLQIGVGDAQR